MRSVPWLVLAVGLLVGCGQRGGLEAGGLVFDRAPFEEQAAPEDRRAESLHQLARFPGSLRQRRRSRCRSVKARSLVSRVAHEIWSSGLRTPRPPRFRTCM